MRSATDGDGRAAPIVVCVQHHRRGRWEVVPVGGRGRISCETLEDARRIAYLWVARAHACELIVRDAYNRVIEREVIDGRRRTPAQAPKSTTNPGGQ